MPAKRRQDVGQREDDDCQKQQPEVFLAGVADELRDADVHARVGNFELVRAAGHLIRRDPLSLVAALNEQAADLRVAIEIAGEIEPEQGHFGALAVEQHLFTVGLVDRFGARHGFVAANDAILGLILRGVGIGQGHRPRDAIAVEDQDLVPERHLVDDPDDANHGDAPAEDELQPLARAPGHRRRRIWRWIDREWARRRIFHGHGFWRKPRERASNVGGRLGRIIN